MMVNKAFYKPTDGGARRSVTSKDSKSKPRICVYPGEDNSLFPP